MSIQSAFLSALSSLNAEQAQTNVISNNVANASTTGYAEQEVSLSEIVYGGTGQGVAAGTVQSVSDAALSGAANQAASAQSYSQEMTDVLSGYTAVLGTSASSSTSATEATTATDTLSTAMSGLQSALTAVSASPGDATTQQAAVTAAQSLVSTFHTLDTAISSAREQADSGIASGVTQVNSDLQALAANEKSLQQASALGESTAGYESTRNSLISDISQYVPVQTNSTSNGSITLTTDGGTTLYDGVAHTLSFTATPDIQDGTTGLSGVTVDGHPLASSQNGSIAADLQLRDTTLPGFSSQLSQLAGNVINAFQSADPSVSTGQTGLFTAGGAALTTSDPTQMTGLAGTIALNASVDPGQGGDAWRIQAGAQATGEGQADDTTTVNQLVAAMGAAGSYSAAAGIPTASSMTSAATGIAGSQQSTSATWEANNTSRTTQLQTAQTSLSNATGVNVDQEMQRLILVQQTYAASAQVIQTAASMLTTLNTSITDAINS